MLLVYNNAESIFAPEEIQMTIRRPVLTESGGLLVVKITAGVFWMDLAAAVTHAVVAAASLKATLYLAPP